MSSKRVKLIAEHQLFYEKFPNLPVSLAVEVHN